MFLESGLHTKAYLINQAHQAFCRVLWSFSRTLERSSLACREDSSWRRPWCLSGPGSGGDCNSGDGLGEETKPSPARHWEPCSQAPFGILLDCPAQSGSAGREVAMKTVFGRRGAVSLL